MLSAILFDYDGTLADTLAINIEVTREVFRRMDWGKNGGLPWPLRSVADYRRANYRYKNWREMYIQAYGMTEEETERAGALWEESQRAVNLEPRLFEGVPELLAALRGRTLGICSQNSAGVIRDTLGRYGVADTVSAIVGHEDVNFDSQKPHPAGFLRCLDELGIRDGRFCYIGDHPEDMAFAKNAQAALRDMGRDARVYCVAALWSGAPEDMFTVRPDAAAKSPGEVLRFIEELEALQ